MRAADVPGSAHQDWAQRATDLLTDLLAGTSVSRRPVSIPAQRDANVAEIQSRLRARETPLASFCWRMPFSISIPCAMQWLYAMISDGPS